MPRQSYSVSGLIPNGRYPVVMRADRSGLARLEHYLLYLAVFLAPFLTLRFTEVFFTLSDLFFCASFVLLLITGRILAAPLGRLTILWMIGFALLLFGLLLASLLEGDPVRGFIVLVQYFFAYVVLLFALARDEPGAVERLALIALASVILVDIHGIYSFYFVGYIAGSTVVSGARRLGTLLGQPNGAAALNASVLPFVLYFWLTGRMKSWLALPILVLIFVTVVLTSSNSGLFIAVGALLIFAGSAMSYRLAWRLLILVVGLVAVLVAGGDQLLPETFRLRVMDAMVSGDIDQAGTYVDRLKLVREAADMILQKEIVFVGIGADQFRIVSEQGAPVHNLILLLWVEGGVFALLGWLIFSVVGIKLALDVRRVDRNIYLSATVLSSIFVFVAFAAVTAHLYARYSLIPLLVSYGMAESWLRLRSERPAR